MEKKQNILVLINTFNGGYQSFKIFYDEIIKGINTLGHEPIIVDNVADANRVCKNNKISFSINIGKYDYYINNQPLYDVYGLINYDWIIDNPIKYIKYGIDTKSSYNRLIFIDKDFSLIEGFGRDDYLWIPLGGPIENINNEVCRKNAILVPWDLRTEIPQISDIIDSSIMHNVIWEFINSFNYDQSYIKQYNAFLENKPIEESDKFFLLTNKYIRTKKRIDIINSIRNWELVIPSDYQNSQLIGPNIRYIPTGNFAKTIQLQRQYKYILNSTPNYDYCVHERISYGSANGAIVITDSNSLLQENDFPMVFTYEHLSDIEFIIDESIGNEEEILFKQRECLKPYKMNQAILSILLNYAKTRK